MKAQIQKRIKELEESLVKAKDVAASKDPECVAHMLRIDELKKLLGEDDGDNTKA